MTEDRTISAGDRIPITIEEELRNSYLDYAMSVIIGRALPDVRDGLKPVHRRILYGMWEGGNTAGKPYKKSARIVGDVMGKYHPHGDAAIYDTAVRLAQDFSMRYCLVDGQGNFGSIDGDAAAAMRYTEVRLTRLAEELLGDDIAKATVDWGPNYDGSLEEPLVLPAKIPNLVVNGSSGIAVGMATNIPPHNLTEVVSACIALIRNPALSFEELLRLVPGPDFPTGAIIHGRAGIVDAYRSGRGIIRMRARVRIEEAETGKRARLIVEELPYQVNKANLVEKIAALVQAKRLDGIADLRDESDRDGIRVVIELKRDAVPEVVLNNLYTSTNLQTTFGANLLAVVNNQPKTFTLRELLEHFISHRREVVTRRTRFDLARARERAHILEGLVIALDKLDEVIRLIRAASDPAVAREELMRRFGLSKLQSQAILDMRLQRLTGLERDKIVAEYQEVMALIAHLEQILASPQMVLEIIVAELEEARATYGDSRRSEIRDNVEDIAIEDLIVEEDMAITVSRDGYVKRSPLSAYRAQRRGGRGRLGMATKEEDLVERLFVASTHATMLFFTTTGRVFAKKVYELPEAGPASRGRALVNLLPVEPDERVATVLPIRDFAEHPDSFLFFATQKGRVKKTPLTEYAKIRSSGIRGVVVNDGDRLLSVHLTSGGRHVFIGTRRGRSIRFSEDDVRSMGRVSAGVRGIALRSGDEVVEVSIFDPEEHSSILVVTELGYGKRTPVDEFRVQGRGGYGITLVKVTERNGAVAGIHHVDEDDGLIVVTERGMLIRTRVGEIGIYGRAARGVRIIRLDEGDRVVALARLDDSDEVADLGDEPGEPLADVGLGDAPDDLDGDPDDELDDELDDDDELDLEDDEDLVPDDDDDDDLDLDDDD